MKSASARSSKPVWPRRLATWISDGDKEAVSCSAALWAGASRAPARSATLPIQLTALRQRLQSKPRQDAAASPQPLFSATIAFAYCHPAMARLRRKNAMMPIQMDHDMQRERSGETDAPN